MLDNINLADIEARIREADCQALEDYRKGVAPAPVLYKATVFGFIKAQQQPSDGGTDGNDLMTFVASEESPDRIGDVIDVKGWELDSFKGNPVFLYAHDHFRPAIGTVPEIKVDEKQLLAMVKWDSEDALAKELKGKYQRGVMKAVSVGFRPIEFEDIKEDKGANKRQGIHFKRQELLELSAVNVPMHPVALRKAYGIEHAHDTQVLSDMIKRILKLEMGILAPVPDNTRWRDAEILTELKAIHAAIKGLQLTQIPNPISPEDILAGRKTTSVDTSPQSGNQSAITAALRSAMLHGGKV